MIIVEQFRFEKDYTDPKKITPRFVRKVIQIRYNLKNREEVETQLGFDLNSRSAWFKHILSNPQQFPLTSKKGVPLGYRVYVWGASPTLHPQLTNATQTILPGTDKQGKKVTLWRFWKVAVQHAIKKRQVANRR